LYASKVLVGHILAFAGIDLFESFELYNKHMSVLWGAAAGTLVMLVVFRVVARCIRDRVDGHREGRMGMQYGLKTPKWRDAVCEAEDDGCSIFFSYIVQDLIVGHAFGAKAIENTAMFELRSDSDVWRLFYCQLGVIGVLVLLSYLQRPLNSMAGISAKISTSAYRRSVTCLQIVTAMSMSWLALLWFFWVTAGLFKTSHEMVEIISAAVLTASSVAGIIILDIFADHAAAQAGGSTADELEEVEVSEEEDERGIEQGSVHGQAWAGEDKKNKTPKNLKQRAMALAQGEGKSAVTDHARMQPRGSAKAENVYRAVFEGVHEQASWMKVPRQTYAAVPQNMQGQMFSGPHPGYQAMTFAQHRGMNMGHDLQDGVQNLQQMEQDALSQAFDVGQMERAIRVIIGAFALAVGLAWEKAFHASLEVVVDSVEVLESHYVYAQIAIAVVNSIIIMPPWLKFIVPNAKKTSKQHQEMIMLAERQN